MTPDTKNLVLKAQDKELSAEDKDALKLEAALGHKQALNRGFGLFSLTSLGIIIANSWSLTGGSIVLAIGNGGPMALLYGLILVTIFYTLISASLAELVSSIPSSGGVYHWASVTAGPRYGRVVGWYAGFLNLCGWLLSAASISSTLGSELVALYHLSHPETEWKSWQVFIAFQIMNWLCCCIVIFGNRFLPLINKVAFYLSMGGLFVTIVVLTSMSRGRHASDTFVWKKYTDRTGWNNDGLCFILGLINAAFAVGTPDCQSHVAEEIPEPEKNVPKGIMIQIGTSFITTFAYLIALFYSINDIDLVFDTTTGSPVSEIYRQATGSTAGALGLTAVLFLATFPTLIGTLITGGRTFWTLSRDNAAPFGDFFSKISPTFGSPLRATIAVSTVTTFLGVIQVGSTTAFSALIGSYVVLSTLSYAGAILPHVLTGRKTIVPGPFHLGKAGFAINIASLLYIAVTVVFFCFPFIMPVEAGNMNYTSVIVSGFVLLIALWWFVHGTENYEGPKYFKEAAKQFADSGSVSKSELE
ncbi:amino acid transporter [Choiromyces venosus 120613-1]|uniref:Amino acid transporter n=1 Tax=Choiromyces venosus 120613-1 TaxID=1336337 RepID=A0A3N4K7B3_9PEZI|nr:amino acid transporter [Choiromyces venosus 120613-1]